MFSFTRLREKTEFLVRHIGMGRGLLPELKRLSRAKDTYIYGFNPFQLYRFLNEDDQFMYFETPLEWEEGWTKAGWKLNKASSVVHVHVTHSLGDREIYYNKEEYEFFIKHTESSSGK